MTFDGLWRMSCTAGAVLDGAVADATKHYWMFVVPPVLFAVCSVVVVVQFRTPFKIVGSVVAGVLVLVVHLRQIVGIGYERKCDETMDRHALAIACTAQRQMNCRIGNVAAYGLHHLEARSVALCEDAGDATKVADLVHAVRVRGFAPALGVGEDSLIVGGLCFHGFREIKDNLIYFAAVWNIPSK